VYCSTFKFHNIHISQGSAATELRRGGRI